MSNLTLLNEIPRLCTWEWNWQIRLAWNTLYQQRDSNQELWDVWDTGINRWAQHLLHSATEASQHNVLKQKQRDFFGTNCNQRIWKASYGYFIRMWHFEVRYIFWAFLYCKQSAINVFPMLKITSDHFNFIALIQRVYIYSRPLLLDLFIVKLIRVIIAPVTQCAKQSMITKVN